MQIQRLLPFLFLMVAIPSQSYPYRVTDLGALPGRTSSVARGISADGTKIVGWCIDRGFLWEEGKGIRELPPPPGYTSAYGYDVNDRGLICGQAGLEVTGPTPARAILWDANLVPQNLGTLGGRFSTARAINRLGLVAGTSEVLPTSTLWHGFLWQPGLGMVDVTPSATDHHASGLNDFSQVVGHASYSAWRYTPGIGVEYLGQPSGFAFTAGFAINDAGQVCASATTASGNSERHARYTDGIGWEILGGIGEHCTPTGINSFGQVVGTSTSAPRAPLYTDGLGLQDLNQLVDPAGRWFILQGFEINDRGQISGHAFSNVIAETRAIRLDPTFTTVRGAGCVGGTGRVPKLGVAGLPTANGRISILLAEGRRNGQALLLVATSAGSVVLPGGCTLLVGFDPWAHLLPLDQIGRGRLTLDLPGIVTPATVHVQYASIDPTAPNGMFALSNAVEVRLQ